MAQTISIQRGSVTYTARGDNTAGTSNITTLFTNTSSGSGTRVIINYLTVQNPYVTGSGYDQTGARCSGFLGVVSSGTTGSIIGGMTGNQSFSSVFQMPISDPGIAAVGGNSTLFASPRFRASVANQNQIGFSGTSPNNISLSVTDATNFGYCPRTFWIGPSDVMKWWPNNSSYSVPSGKSSSTFYYTQTLYYSFTCITES
jgi:hypothetical protein